MKKIDFNNIKDEYFKKNVVVTKYNEEKIRGLYNADFLKLGMIYIGKEQVLVKDIKTIELLKDNNIYKYVVVNYCDDYDYREYSYKTTIKDIKEGDIVLVDRAGLETEAEVVDVILCTRDTAPYPVEKTKDVIKLLSSSSDYDDEDDDDDEFDSKVMVSSDGFRYYYNEIEQKVYDKLRELGYNEKASLRVILILRTHRDSDKQCDKMLGFLDSFDNNQHYMNREIEKYARTLADDENWDAINYECPAVGEGSISIIDCLDISDEDSPNLGEASSDDYPFNEKVCKKCKWHNIIMQDQAYENKDAIIFNGLTESKLDQINYDDVLAFTVAEGGAFGRAGNIELVVLENSKPMGYQTNPLYGGLNISALYKVIPWLKKLYVAFSFTENIPSDWFYIDMGFGNHLFIRDNFKEEAWGKLDGKKPSEIYNSWKDLLADTFKTYIKDKEIIKNKKPKLGESIYDYIDRSILPGEKLPDDFSLKSFKTAIHDNIFFVDGFVDYAIKPERDDDVLEILKNMLFSLDSETLNSNVSILDNYYRNHKQNTVLAIIDEFLDYMTANFECHSKEAGLIYLMALSFMYGGREIETVKIGLAILGAFPLQKLEEYSVLDDVKKLALSDEFTLYACTSISSEENFNDYRFELLQKLSGYGKNFILPDLEVTSKEIENWLIRRGALGECNTRDLVYAITDKVDILKYIKKNTLTHEDITGLCLIIETLLDEFDFDKETNDYTIHSYDYLIDVFKELVMLSKNFLMDIDYLELITLIYDYLEENDNESSLINDINNIYKSEIIKDKLLDNIESGKDLSVLLNISKNIPDFDIYEKVYDIFKENLIMGEIDLATNLLNYLSQDEVRVPEILDLLRNNIDYYDNLGKPENILDTDLFYMVNIMRMLKKFPLMAIDLVRTALRSKSFLPRRAALDTIDTWLQNTDLTAKEYLPQNLYLSLVYLKDVEVVKDLKEKLNKILGITEDLTGYENPEMKFNPSIVNNSFNDTNLFNGDLNTLFNSVIKNRGQNYYKENKVYQVGCFGDGYEAKVRGSNPYNDYEVEIKVDDNNNITSMSCTCPYEANCKHEYATILYIRDNF